jgi:hypothetical protein
LFAFISILIKVTLNPLEKLEIVLVLALDEFFYFDGLGNVEPCETLLQHFEIANELIFILGLHVDLGQGY